MSREKSLVNADWVAQNLNNPAVVVVEVDEDTSLYEQGHIEGAITFHWRSESRESTHAIGSEINKKMNWRKTIP